MSDASKIDQRPAARSASRPRKAAGIILIVLHSDPRPAAEALAAYTAPSAPRAPHYYIDGAGDLTQLVPEQRAARHSGKANWSKRRRDIDQISIGIALEHTPGAPYLPAQLEALQGLIARARAGHAIDAAGVVRWESELPGISTADGVLVPADLPAPIAPPTVDRVLVLGDEEPIPNEGTICGGVMDAGPLVLSDEAPETMASPLVLSDDGDPAAQARLR